MDEYESYFIYGSGKNIDHHTGEPLNIKGCVANGISEDVAKTIWNKMYEFAKYAFNKSHGAVYAVIAMQTAWLSYYYPVIFLKANLNVYIGNPDKLRMYLAFCTRNNIEILPPSVNESEQFFSLNEDGTAIRFGLKGIRNLDKVSRIIIEERNTNGKFKSLNDFVRRMSTYPKFSKRVLEALIYVGALDDFDGSRKSKLENVEKMLEIEKATVFPNQATIFDLSERFHITNLEEIKVLTLDNANELDKDEKLNREYEYSGFYITGHPLEDYTMMLNHSNLTNISSLVTGDNASFYQGSLVKVGGIITDLEKKNTKKGNVLYTFTLKDMTGDLSTVCFSDSFKKNEDKIEEGSKVVITGKFDVNDFGPQLVVDTVVDLRAMEDRIVGVNLISSESLNEARKQYVDLAKLVPSETGEVALNFIKNGIIQPGINKCKLSLELFDSLQKIFGEQKCRIIYK